MSRLYTLLLVSSLFLFSIPLRAELVALEYGGVHQPYYVGGSTALSGQFDLSTELDQSFFQSPFEVTYARLIVHYEDDASDAGYSLYSLEEDRSGWSGWYKPPAFFSSTDWQRTYNNYSKEEYRNEEEFADITLSSGSAEYSRVRQATSGYTSNIEFTRPQSGSRLVHLGIRTITGTCGAIFGSGSTCTRTAYARQYYYDYDSRTYRDYSTARSGYYSTNSSVLEAFSDEGILDFEIAAAEGDFMVTGLTLEVDIAASAAVVPLPTAVWLFVSAVAGLVGFQVRNK